MAAKNIWNVKYVAGNPAMFNKITLAAGGPFRRGEALEHAAKVANNGGGWRVWVDNEGGARIFESQAEKDFQLMAAQADRGETERSRTRPRG